MDDYVNPVIAKTEKLLNRLNEIDSKFLSLEDELLELKLVIDDIKNSISETKDSSSINKPSTFKSPIEVVKSKQVQSKTIIKK